jgi:hypothetical protein
VVRAISLKRAQIWDCWLHSYVLFKPGDKIFCQIIPLSLPGKDNKLRCTINISRSCWMLHSHISFLKVCTHIVSACSSFNWCDILEFRNGRRSSRSVLLSARTSLSTLQLSGWGFRCLAKLWRSKFFTSIFKCSKPCSKYRRD